MVRSSSPVLLEIPSVLPHTRPVLLCPTSSHLKMVIVLLPPTSHDPKNILPTLFSSARSIWARTLPTFFVRTTKNLTPCRRFSCRHYFFDTLQTFFPNLHGCFRKTSAQFFYDSVYRFCVKNRTHDVFVCEDDLCYLHTQCVLSIQSN